MAPAVMFVRTLQFEIERLFGAALLPEGALIRDRRARGGSPFGGTPNRRHDHQERCGGYAQQK